MAERTDMIIRRFAQVTNMLLQIEGPVEVDPQCSDCMREIYNRTCDIDGCYGWKCAQSLLSTKQNGIMIL